MFIIIQAIFFVTSVTTYTMVARSQTRRDSLFEDVAQKSSTNSRIVLVSLTLNVTFVVFYVVPNYIPVQDDHRFFLILCGIIANCRNGFTTPQTFNPLPYQK